MERQAHILEMSGGSIRMHLFILTVCGGNESRGFRSLPRPAAWALPFQVREHWWDKFQRNVDLLHRRPGAPIAGGESM